jgi:hypothetical protein
MSCKRSTTKREREKEKEKERSGVINSILHFVIVSKRGKAGCWAAREHEKEKGGKKVSSDPQVGIRLFRVHFFAKVTVIEMNPPETEAVVPADTYSDALARSLAGNAFRLARSGGIFDNLA